MTKEFLKNVFLLTCLYVSAIAQLATTTSLVGTVTDSSGRAVQNAKITAVETRTAATLNTTTNEQGYYSFEFIPVGEYSVTVEQPGFQKVTKTGIQVSTNQTVRSEFRLEVGQLTQSVTIQAEVSAIKTDDASVSEILSTRAVSELPLNGRDPMMLAVTTPGVLLGTKSSMTGIPPGNDFVGAGTREIQNSLSLDGISIMNNLITTTPTRPMVETVQEVEVQTGTYSAQYGAYMGVHINMVTKGGHEPVPREHARVPAQRRSRRAQLSSPCRHPRIRPPRSRRSGKTSSASSSMGRSSFPKSTTAETRRSSWRSYEGLRLTQQSTSLSTQMPAEFFNGNFSQVPASSITGGAIKDPLNGNAVSRQYYSAEPHLAGCSQTAAVLSRAQSARACQ